MKDNQKAEPVFDLEAFFTVNLDLLCIADTQGLFLKLNKSWAETLGYPIETLLGRNFLELIHPDDVEPTLKAIQTLDGQTPILNFTNRYRHKDGSWRYIEWRSYPQGNLIYAAARDISERIQAEDKILQLSKAVEYNPATILITDNTGNITYVNEKFQNLTGYQKDEVIGKNPRILKSGEQDPAFYNDLWETISSGKDWRGNFHNKKKNGDLYWESALISPILDHNGDITHYVAVKEDITGQRAAEEALKESQERLDMFFRQSLDGFFFMMLDEPVEWDDTTDKDAVMDYIFTHQRITKINEAMLQQYGASEDQFIGLTPNDFYQHDLAYGKAVWRQFFDEGKLHIDTREQKFDGSTMMIEGDYICMYDAKGRITGHFGIQRDVTFEREARQKLEASEARYRELSEQLHEVSIRDPLTGLYNRRYLYERLDAQFEQTKRDGRAFSVAILDIDHFKMVNDTYGHQAGDLVLKDLSQVLSDNIRGYDILGRYGGEEFIMVFVNTSLGEAVRRAERILDTVRSRVVRFDGHEISYTFSCGVCNSGDCTSELSVENVIIEADKRMYLAKTGGRNRVIGNPAVPPG